jgi:hypothetical protein
MFEMLDLKKINKEVTDYGYIIIHGAIDELAIEEMRNYWINYYSDIKISAEEVIWSPYLGEENQTCYSDDGFQCLHRTYDYLWNESVHKLTRNICLDLQKIKNKAFGKPEGNGLEYSSKNFGLYVSTSCYPENIGHLGMHRDKNDGKDMLVHYIVPLTIQGEDYKSGGLVLQLENGKMIDVDSLMRKGSILFYNAGLSHGVEKIVPFPNKSSIGRIQTFGITTNFIKPLYSKKLWEDINLKKYLTYKVVSAKNKFLKKIL